MSAMIRKIVLFEKSLFRIIDIGKTDIEYGL